MTIIERVRAILAIPVALLGILLLTIAGYIGGEPADWP